MAPSHDEVAINRTTIECGRAAVIAANRRPLDWLNFFLADVKDGLGPFLAIFLMSSQHWDAERIGVVLTIAGVATVLARGPGGALVDAVHWKRTLIAIGALVVAISAVVMALAPQFWPIALAQAASGIADAIFPLAVAAISLGIVGRGLFSRRVGRNEAFNHAGNAVTAIVAGLAGYFIAPGAVLWLIAALALASIAAVYVIDGRAIDHEAARGADNGGQGDQPSRLSGLFENRSLLFFTAAITLFHFADRREAVAEPSAGEQLVHRRLHYHGADRDGAHGHSRRPQGRRVGPQADLSRRVCRRPSLHADPGPLCVDLDPDPGWHRGRYLWCALLHRHCRPDEGHWSLQSRPGGEFGVLGTRGGIEQWRGGLHRQQFRLLGGVSVSRGLCSSRVPGVLARRPGNA
jgi:Major Facilitator Superfamily